MTSSRMQQAALTARDARQALLELQKLVDNATQKIHAAELEITGLAIGRTQPADPFKALRAAVQTMQSPAIEAAISEARDKMNHAAAFQVQAQPAGR
jgi:hypothetical protein